MNKLLCTSGMLLEISTQEITALQVTKLKWLSHPVKNLLMCLCGLCLYRCVSTERVMFDDISSIADYLLLFRGHWVTCKFCLIIACSVEITVSNELTNANQTMGVCGIEPIIRFLHFNFVSTFKNMYINPSDWFFFIPDTLKKIFLYGALRNLVV